MSVQTNASTSPIRFYPPGCKTPGAIRPALTGPQAVIAHSLTYYYDMHPEYGIPPAIALEINKLPSNERIEEYNQIQRDYLSFTVYTLKQMAAQRTIQAETAWSLLHWDLNMLEQVTEDNFTGMRVAFMEEARRLSDMEPSSIQRPSLLEWEFWARGGGLRGGGEFSADSFIFENFPENSPLRLEYAKALWLEMRIIERQVGMSGLNEDVSRFLLASRGAYRYDPNMVQGSIDLFQSSGFVQSETAIDSVIKAEIGHWMFKLFYSVICIGGRKAWLSELMDRMNVAGYPIWIDEYLDRLESGVDINTFPPVVRTFLEGGFYIASKKFGFPLYPYEFPSQETGNYERDKKHFIAEKVEKLIRKKILEKKLADPSIVAYQTYRKMGVYLSLLALEGKSEDEIMAEIEYLDMKKLNDYYSNCTYKNCKEIVPSALEAALKDPDYAVRSAAAEALGELGDIAALPALEAILSDKGPFVRNAVVKALIKIRKLTVGEEEYDRLYAYQLLAQNKWTEIIGLGRAALPALEGALKDPDYNVRASAINALGKLGDMASRPALEAALNDEYSFVKDDAANALGNLGDIASRPALEAALNDPNYAVRGAVAKALIKIRKLTAGEEEYDRLYAYQLLAQNRGREIIGLGSAALPALEAALNDYNYSARIFAAAILGEVGNKIACPVLEAALKDQNFNVRAASAEALIKILNISFYCKEYDSLYAYKLVEGLQWEKLVKMGSAALPALEAALNDRYPDVRATATETLKKLGASFAIQAP